MKVLDPKTGKKYILAEQGSQRISRRSGGPRAVQGDGFEGKRYKPLFPFFADRKDGAFGSFWKRLFRVEDGTGIVHAAPAFGEMDFFACKREGIDLVCPVDSQWQVYSRSTSLCGAIRKRRRLGDHPRFEETRHLFSTMGRFATDIRSAGDPIRRSSTRR